jgi:hypothetical protein
MANSEFGIRNAESADCRSTSAPLFRTAHSAFRILFAVFLFLGLVDFSFAQPPAKPKLVDVRIGLDDKYKLGYWTPVRVVVQSGATAATGVVELTTADGDGVPVVYSSEPVQLVPGRTATADVYAKLGRVAAEIEVVFRSESQILLRTRLDDDSFGTNSPLPLALGVNDRWIVCIGRSATLAEAAAEVDLGDQRRLIVSQLLDPRDLPTRAEAYEAVDAVALLPESPEPFAAVTADSAQVAALTEWLRLGGRLWTGLSVESLPLFSAGGTLAELAPVGVGSTVPLPRTEALEKFVGAESKQSISPAALRRQPLTVPRLGEKDLIVDAAEGDLPIVVRRAVGFGIVAVTGFRPEHPLLASWSGRTSLVRRVLQILGVIHEREAAGKAKSSGAPNYGYNDLAGQLRSALDQYDDVQVMSFFTLAVMVLGYLVLIGPVDYLFVRRVLKRPEMTWVTFPAIVLATSFGAYYLASWMKGDRLRVSQADVVDFDAATRTARGSWWAGVFSPIGRSYDVRFERPAQPQTSENEASVSWFGLPGDGLGAMHAGGAAGFFDASYSVAPDGASLAHVPIQVWSSKMLAGRDVGRVTTTLHAPIQQEADGRLRGTLKNPFTFAIDGGLLCYGTKAYEIGRLEPGDERELASFAVRDVQSLLQGRYVVHTTNKNPLHVGKPHDPGSNDVDAILQKMMFFEAAGGAEHANLKHQFQSFLDLSLLLRLRRAVLVGQVDPAQLGALQLKTGSKEANRAPDRRTSFVRLAIPVEGP